MMYRISASLLLSLLLSPFAVSGEVISLEGTWQFQLDADNVGFEQQWYSKSLEDSVQLPGTTDTNQKGIESDERREDRLTRKWYWKGAAWYQRTVTVPESWAGQHITLFFERSKNTRLWVDNEFCGRENTLSAFQIFDVTKFMMPGKHTITVLVDNSKLPPVGPSHAIDERTQTNWNGIIGKMELRATDPVWLKDVQVYPDAAKKQAKVRVKVGNITGKAARGEIEVGCESYNVENPAKFLSQNVKVNADAGETVVEFVYKPGESVPLWDEFNPAMLELKLNLTATAGDQSYADQKSIKFGMRDFVRFRNRLYVNGKQVLLRGRIDCCFYPLTGYPPMDKAGWDRIFGILKEWGLNHVRYHSWCPPKAAFEAADEAGFYLQPEFPNKRSGFNAPEDTNAAIYNIDRLEVDLDDSEVTLFEYGFRESEMIFRDFGNHPSFTLYTLGNEMGRNRGMYELVAHFQQTDPRHLYAQGSNNMHWNPTLAEGDDFWVIQAIKDFNGESLLVRSAFYYNSNKRGHIEYLPPSTMVDFNDAISGVPVPMITHEIAQPTTYPDYSEIPKFTGVTRPGNYEIFRDRLEQAGMLDQAVDFKRASGALSAICKREAIEASLRTADLGGFQLLDIQDFGGQGTALVGMLDLFMDSKGIITPEERRQYCCPTVPLVRMKKYCWTADETFIGRVQIAHYGPEDLSRVIVKWSLADAEVEVVAEGQCDRLNVPQGTLSEVDAFSIPLSEIKTPQRLDLTIELQGTPYRNSYPLWVFPTEVDTSVPESVLLSTSLNDDDTKKQLANGGRVLLLPPLDELPQSIEGAFSTDFWSPMFAAGAKKRGQPLPPGTMGILCDPQHSSLAKFPTEFHSNWQWWHLVKNSRPIILDDTPDSFRPTVQVIDNISRCHKLGLVFETRVGDGKLLVCAIDLMGQKDKPAAGQMLHSLLEYTASPAFAPESTLDPELLEKLLP